MSKFKVGDRVQFLEIPELDISVGETGRVLVIDGTTLWIQMDSADREIGVQEHEVTRLGDTEISKATNPKDAIGATKMPLHLWPTTATAHGCLALLDGACKYGRSNFRQVGVRASIYVDAAKRHLDAWFEGEETASDSGVHHLGHALACIAVILDAQEAGKLNDDRMTPGGYHAMMKRLTPLVNEIKARHADKSPKHYTIADKEQQ